MVAIIIENRLNKSPKLQLLTIKPSTIGWGSELKQGHREEADLSLQYFLHHSEDDLDKDEDDDTDDDVDDGDSIYFESSQY